MPPSLMYADDFTHMSVYKSVNRSYSQGYKQRRAYIATQGPLSGTVDDLWRMILEYKCSCIVMLCDMTENDKVVHPLLLYHNML